MRSPLLLLVASSLSAATVQPFDGAAMSAANLGFEKDVVIAGAAKAKLADCDWIEPGVPTAVARARSGLWLSDGGWLPVDRLAPADADDRLVASGPLGDLTLPLSAVLGWGPELLAPGENNTDRVQVAASGAFQGRVLGIKDGKLRVESPLSPQPLELPLGDVASLRLALPTKTPRGVVLAATLDAARPPLLVLPQPGLPLAAAPTASTGEALAGVRLRVEGGRRVYLGALRPAKVEEAGAFDVTWHWRADADLDGGPIQLGGARYAHGVSMHSKATLTWDLGGQYARLRALAGIADLVAPEGDCAVDILADGKSLWSRPSVRGGDKPIALDLDLAGAKTLEVRVDYGARYDIGDHFTLADAWMLKVK